MGNQSLTPVATSGIVLHVPNLYLPRLIILSTLIFNTLRVLCLSTDNVQCTFFKRWIAVFCMVLCALYIDYLLMCYYL